MWPQTIENRAALRTAIAALAAVLISFSLHLQTPYWSGMTVVVVSNLYTGSIIDKAMMRIIGTIAGAFLGIYLASLVVNSFLLYLLTCFLVVTVSVYYYNLSTYGYAYLLGALCTFIVVAQLAIDPHNAFYVAIWRPVEIGIGVLVSAISAYCIFPNHLKDNIREQLDSLFTDLITDFTLLETTLQQDNIDFTPIEEKNLALKKKVRKAVELIGAMNREIGITRARVDELRAILDTFYALSRQMQYLVITMAQTKDKQALHTLDLQPLFHAIRHDLMELRLTFINSSGEGIQLQTEQALTALDKDLESASKQLPVNSDFMYSLIHFLQQVGGHLVTIQSLLAHTPTTVEPTYKAISKIERLRSDPDLIKQCIKAGLAVILALSFWLVSNWPGGLNGIISSLIISIRKNLFEMKNTSVHRLLGCTLGGGLALLSLYLFELNLYDFVCVIFLGVWVFTYFMFKWPRYAYIGLQANIALIISLAQEGGPPVLLDPPLQRLGGIVIGIVASFIVGNFLWRSDALTVLNRYVNKLHLYLTFNLKQVLLVSGKTKSLHDLANLFWISRGLIESLAEERLKPKKQEWYAALSKRFESVVIIQAAISHILATVDRENAHTTAKALELDLPAEEQKLVALYEQGDAEGGKAFGQELMAFMGGQSSCGIGDASLRNLWAYLNALNQLALRCGR